jgi:hypothetical protein
VILADFPPMQNGEDAPLVTQPESVASAGPGAARSAQAQADKRPVEIGGRAGPEPTRFGDWEKNGRCIDF